MKTSSTTFFLGTAALMGAVVAGSGLEGCRSSDTGSSSSNGGNTTTTTHSGTTSGAGGAGGSVTAQVVTIQQITDPTAAGHVGVKTPVLVQNAVAMSAKILVSKSSSGSCLWGVFISAPGLTETAANTGILAVSYGTPAEISDGGTTAYCPVLQPNALYPNGQPAGDSFPDDIGPGDVIDVTGVTDSYIPATCTSGDAGVGASSVPGYQISKVTSVTRHTGKVTPPKPHVLSSTDLTTLAAGSDTTWLNGWGNVRVEADNVTAKSQNGVLTDTYGHMLLDEGTNGIEVGDKLYYVGLAKTSDACYSGPTFLTAPPINFSSITGFVYLDFCNWSLIPSDKCHDLNPPSADCAAAVSANDAGASSDAGADPAQVCLH